MARYILIFIVILFVFIYFKRRFVLKSIFETLKVNPFLRLNLLKIIYKIIFKRFI